MRTTNVRAGAAMGLMLLLAACGTAAPDTEEVALPDGFGEAGASETQPTGEEPTGEESTGDGDDGDDGGDDDGDDGDESIGDAPASDAGQGGTATEVTPDVCFNPEREDWATGSPSEASWGEEAEVSVEPDVFTVNVADPTIRESEFSFDNEPRFVWEADVTATHVEGMGFTSIDDFVLADTSGNECMISWGDTTLWGLMVYEEGDQETGKAAFLVPTEDIADYQLIFVGTYDREAQQVWKP